MDAQGADRARPYVEAAGATFTTLVDEGNILGRLYGFKAIPNGLLIDERGVLRYKRLGGFDIRRADTAAVLERWAAGSDLTEPSDHPEASPASNRTDAEDLFRRGQDLFRGGKPDEAVGLWRRALELDPKNYIIRKQIWAVEHPERFYEGDIDYAWQREQMAGQQR
jgi:tetratricopeptide (TPR) repeat protein